MNTSAAGPEGRVLVVGGGIGGLATAAALARFDIPALVLERRDQPADGGLGINLPGNAITAVQALGLGEQIEQLGAPLRRREYRNQRGRLVFSVDEDAFWGPSARSRCVLRGELMALLGTAVPPETVRLGAEVRGLSVDGDTVTAELAEGATEGGALLVGADGVGSMVRPHAGHGESPRAALLSRASWRFVTGNPGIDCWVVWSGSAGTVLFIPLGADRIYGWVSVPKDVASFDDVVEAFDRFPGVVRDTLAAARAEPVPPHWSPLEEVRPAAWTTGRVVLLGDAAHATAPVWAQGAALAMEDALVLADILRRSDSWSDAGAELARRRRSRVEHVQAMTDRLSRAARLPSVVRDLILPAVGPRTYRATYGALRTSVV
jgi:2-polyprenyl-6-methoxyphenol hydroxylase-like FAD-dependent oxidoreductase